VRKPAKTFSHLAPRGRMPTDYEVVTSKLLYHLDRGFEVPTSVSPFYEANRESAAMRGRRWDDFRDPRVTTYSSYVHNRDRRECVVDGCLEALDEPGYEAGLDPEWARSLESFAALRYPMSGLQMLAAYVGHMAPSGSIAIASAFQAADEMRRIQRIAYRIAQRRRSHPEFASGSRATFESDPAFQPLRRIVERLLVTYDWSESLVATNVCLKPVFDELVMHGFADAARRAGDPMFGRVLDVLGEDCRWHRELARSFVELAFASDDANRAVVDGFVRAWRPVAHDAARALAGALFGEGRDARDASDAAVAASDAMIRSFGTEVASS